jgi:prophage regulatory protein
VHEILVDYYPVLEQPETAMHTERAPAGLTSSIDEAFIREPTGPHPAQPSTPVHEGIVREHECRQLTGLSRSTRWRMERIGLFPRRRRISPGCTGWLRSEIAVWIASR